VKGLENTDIKVVHKDDKSYLYFGEMKKDTEDVMHGRGVNVWKHGEVNFCECKDNLWDGKATVVNNLDHFAKYNWKEGKKNQQVIEFYENGTKKVAQYNDDVKENISWRYLPNGNIFIDRIDAEPKQIKY
jgi:antitoxin component YwqK of YwqJK toxin-antitoxin module